MPRFIAGLFFALFFSPLAIAAEPLQTVAEKSEFKATSRFADVVAFCDELAKRSPAVKVSTFGTTNEGRKLPLMVVADPPIATPEEAVKSGKLVVLAFANIHAGEVDGKEALLALARDLTAEKGHPLLKDLVILFVPILNADGNEKIDVKNRPEQAGPVDGVGIRENAQSLDLNRDFVKLETPEVRALVKLFNTWDPSVVIDCHTTNGSKHRFTLTYDANRYPSSDAPLPEWVHGKLLPDVGQRVKAATGFDTGPYGNFNADRTKWETYRSSPRFGLQYVALRNRIGILSESYTYASFKDRVKASHAFVKACFEVAAEKKADVKKLIVGDTAANIALRTKTIAFPDKWKILGFEEVIKDGKRVATDKTKDYELEYIGKVQPTELVKRPAVGYLVPPKFASAIDTLRRHGIKVEEFREDIDLEVEALQIQSVEIEAKAFQKHQTISVDVKPRTETRRVPAGTVLVRTTQPLGSLAAYLLEPHSEDGLTTWNYFDKDLPPPGKDFPVLRLVKPAPITLGSPRPLAEGRVMNKPITDAMLFGSGGRGFSFGFAGNPVATPQWLPDGEHFLQTKDGKLWNVEARTGKAEPFIDPELFKKSLAALPELKGKVDEISQRTPSRMNPDRTGALVDIGVDIAIAYFDGRPAVRLTKSDGAKEHLTFSPKGDRIAFVRGGNLFAVTIANPIEKKLTADGGGEILNAMGDWVYEEEIFNRAGKAYWWSPDGTQLAWLRFDDAPVKKFNIVNLNTPRGALEAYPYPKAGDPNPHVSLHVAPAAGGKAVALDLGEYKPEDLLISRVGWLPNSKSVFAYVQNRTQIWLDFVVWDEPSAKPKKLFRDSTKAWIDDPGEPKFLKDGSFLFLSERNGWKHLYHYKADGQLLRPLTTGMWKMEVREILRVDPKLNCVFFTATLGGPTRLQLCAVDLEGNRNLYHFDDEKEKIVYRGTHQISLSPAGLLYVDRYTDNQTPTQVRLMEIKEDGQWWPPKGFGTNTVTGNQVAIGAVQMRTLDSNPVYEREEHTFGKFESVQVKMADGFKLEGTLVYPPDFDPSKKYPIWLFTYAGPHMPTVREGYGGGRLLDQTLAASGIVVFRVDPRSASGQSAASAWTAYKQLGVQELKDLEAAVAWLCKNPWADASRVGISGHSYGGFMAGYALTHSKTFSAGIASGPVTDWRLYDSIYTERYMLTPKENPDGYDKSSVVKAAKNLHGKLLIVHGMMDDNVHMQNSVQLADALQSAGKDFEMMFYPRSRHGIASPHYLRLQIDFIRRTMGVKIP